MSEPFVVEQKLRFCDTDMLGHINNAVYAVMYEAGRAEILQAAKLITRDHAPVIARIEIDFLREMNWPGEVRIETEVTRIGNKSLHVRQRLLVGGEITSRAASVLAIIDTRSRRAVPIMDTWRAALAPWTVADAHPAS